ncbi:MAG TPA: protein-L-isoaspartate(D-aspartate) O-methyltransferase [Gemmatimonadales bacterium]|nr:protein-L-isoaspartate(D-aspartate) O-methyltransferase [Gemmatimonadales bacterium]
MALLGATLGPAGQAAQDLTAERFRQQRQAMVRDQIAGQGIRDTGTLRAMGAVPRESFVPASLRNRAYGDHPLPIGLGQTISQPYIVAYMTEVIGPRRGMRVLEVGTGSGYQAAVLAEVGCEVYTVEIFPALADSAARRLTRLGYHAVHARQGDGHFGWPEAAPFDAIVVTAAAGYVPPDLIAQLKPGGRMVIPVGSVYGVQNLILVEKAASGAVSSRTLLPVRFVPLLGGPR